MEKYKNLSRNSSIAGYSTTPQSITIHYTSGEIYEYTIGSAGRQHVATMKHLAKVGWGLGSYIEQVVKLGYARQLQ